MIAKNSTNEHPVAVALVTQSVNHKRHEQEAHDRRRRQACDTEARPKQYNFLSFQNIPFICVQMVILWTCTASARCPLPINRAQGVARACRMVHSAGASGMSSGVSSRGRQLLNSCLKVFWRGGRIACRELVCSRVPSS